MKYKGEWMMKPEEILLVRLQLLYFMHENEVVSTEDFSSQVKIEIEGASSLIEKEKEKENEK